VHQEHLGSSFENFLRKEGTLEETTNRAIKWVLARQLRKVMIEQGLSKSEMARRLRTSRPALDRLLDLDNDAVTLNTLQKAAKASCASSWCDASAERSGGSVNLRTSGTGAPVCRMPSIGRAWHLGTCP
jgi:antitoxin HicB